MKKGYLRLALCPDCRGDAFKLYVGYRPSKLDDFNNGYPFETNECVECGWKTSPMDDFEEMDRYLTAALKGRTKELGYKPFAFRELSLQSSTPKLEDP